MTILRHPVRQHLRSLLLAGVGLATVVVASGEGWAGSLPWPDANPVMRLDRPASRAHRPRPHRAARRHEARARQVLQPAANPTVLKPVAAGSAPAAVAPKSVPLPVARSAVAPAAADTVVTAAPLDANRVEPTAAGPSDGKAGDAATASSRDKQPAPRPEEAAQATTSTDAPADRSDLPASTDVPIPQKPPADRDDVVGGSAAGSDSAGPDSPETTGVSAANAAQEGDLEEKADAGEENAKKAGTDRSADVETPAESAATEGSAPAPKPAETEAAAVARSGLDAAPAAVASPAASSGVGDPGAAETLPITDIPLPEKRPDAPAGVVAPPAREEAPNSTKNLRSRVPEITPAAMVAAAAAIEDAKLCETELKKRGVAFTVGESIAEGECGVLRPIELKTLSSGVSIAPTTFLLCRSALALDQWMSDSVVPAAKANFPGDALKTFRHASTYVCRPRASEAGISEHARGSAIDIGGFGFSSGRTLGIEAQAEGSPEQKFQRAIREAACGPFKTVLGPGTNADHATHFHLDIAARRNGATYCK